MTANRRNASHTRGDKPNHRDEEVPSDRAPVSLADWRTSGIAICTTSPAKRLHPSTDVSALEHSIICESWDFHTRHELLGPPRLRRCASCRSAPTRERVARRGEGRDLEQLPASLRAGGRIHRKTDP